jgi:archaellum biogenesis ATPase FlaH
MTPSVVTIKPIEDLDVMIANKPLDIKPDKIRELMIKHPCPKGRGNRLEWLNVCSMFAHQFSAHRHDEISKVGLELFCEWSATDPELYTYEACEKAYYSFKGCSLTPRTMRCWMEEESKDASHEVLDPALLTTPSKRRFLWDREFAMGGEKPRWFIDKILPKGQLALIYGPSGSGKTFFVLDMISSISRGVDWRGRHVTKSNVIYIAAESPIGIKSRIMAYLTHYNIKENIGFRVLDEAPNFLKDDYISLASDINALDTKTDLIIIDTLAQTTPGANENSSEDMGKAISSCKQLSVLTGAMVLLVHHCGKDMTKGSRGWSGLKAALEFEMEIGHDEHNRTRYAKITKSKNSVSGDSFSFDLQTVSFSWGEDQDFDTSCIVNHPVDNAFTYPTVIASTAMPGSDMVYLTDFVEDDNALEERVKKISENCIDSHLTIEYIVDNLNESIPPNILGGILRKLGYEKQRIRLDNKRMKIWVKI